MLDRAPNFESRARVAQTFASIDETKAAARLVRVSMVRDLKSSKTTDKLCNFQWRVLNTNEHVELVTGDRPLVINCGAKPPPVDVLTLSLTPRKLFVMHTPSFVLDGEAAEKLARIHIHVVCRDARYVYAADNMPEQDVLALLENAGRETSCEVVSSHQRHGGT